MRKKKLSSICKVSNGFAFKSKDYTDDGYRVIRITNVQRDLLWITIQSLYHKK